MPALFLELGELLFMVLKPLFFIIKPLIDLVKTVFPNLKFNIPIPSFFSSPTQLSGRRVKTLALNSLKNDAIHYQYVPFEIGWCYVGKQILAKMFDAGFVTYTVLDADAAVATDSVGEGCLYANVVLTKKGKRLSVDALPAPCEPIDKDMVEEHTTLRTVVKRRAQAVADLFRKIFAPKPDSHQDAKSKTVYLRSHFVDVFKARKIRIINNDQGTSATAEVILMTSNTTDAGRILGSDTLRDGRKVVIQVGLIYYSDLGWILEDEPSFKAAARQCPQLAIS